jgi:acetoin utilization deacetylase AcuC-like enzyme
MKTAYLYDDIYLLHDTGPGHPERAERLTAIDNKIKSREYYDKLVKVEKRKAEFDELEYIHDAEYIQSLKKAIESGIDYLDTGDTVVGKNSFEIALYATGGCLNLCDTIMKGEADTGFCAIRPPGHHAERAKAYGYCLFNNIAISARYIQKKYDIERVAIVDWDVHHGNGTQHSFETNPTVYFFSLHQYPFYPGSGINTERGIGKGKGFTLNIPMIAGSGDDEYQFAFESSIIPELHKFAPQIILISAGFDAHADDHQANMNLSTESYYQFTKLLQGVAKQYCDNRIIAILEGGYNVKALADSVARVMDAFVEE